MPRQDTDEVFGLDGELISRTVVERPDPDPSRAQQAAQARVLLDAVDAASTVASLRSAVKAWMVAAQSVLERER